MPLLSVVTVAVAGLVACSGDDRTGPDDTIEATVEQANPDAGVTREAGADDTSCPEKRSEAFYLHLINGLPRALTLSAPRNGWTCDDWSGVSTPGRAFDNTMLESGERYRFRLERRTNPVGRFTLGVKGFGYEGSDQVSIEGETRAQMEILPRSGGVLEPWVGVVAEQWKGVSYCRFVPLATAPSSWGDTPVAEITDAFRGIDKSLSAMFIVDSGRIGLLYAYNPVLIESPQQNACEARR